MELLWNLKPDYPNSHGRPDPYPDSKPAPIALSRTFTSAPIAKPMSVSTYPSTRPRTGNSPSSSTSTAATSSSSAPPPSSSTISATTSPPCSPPSSPPSSSVLPRRTASQPPTTTPSTPSSGPRNRPWGSAAVIRGWSTLISPGFSCWAAAPAAT
ncbi:UNVERIFIED_CONTAM: hypothetical protein Slati_3782800 [Sesamum latifolium]|uniref:Uncharacterized protein n=1 Tax=Sesamum latifolium TaxID=2727402 RepID=A0AAW2U889_9LAMI